MKQVFYLFGQLDDRDVDWFAQTGQTKSIPPNTTVIQEGTDVNSVLIILQGELSVNTASKGLINTLGWGEIAGEMSFVDKAPAAATLVTTQQTNVLQIPHGRLAERIMSDAQFAARFYRATTLALTDRLREQISGENTDNADSLSPELLDTVHSAGARFDRLLRQLGAN
ncbi:MAG: cyclic nucleotide-binding domain-containing protein [Myxococcota bacterium]|nr:cyclic nucleotide-binding domain-containing protein [Myxococcota bacterium]